MGEVLAPDAQWYGVEDGQLCDGRKAIIDVMSRNLAGRLRGTDIDEESGELRCKVSDGSVLDIKPAAAEANDDPPYWELISPVGAVLEFGPGVRWQMSGADVLASRR